MVLKWWQFRRMRTMGDRFLAEVEKAPRLEDAYHAAMRLPPSPYNRLLREAVHFFTELKPGSLNGAGGDTHPDPARGVAHGAGEGSGGGAGHRRPIHPLARDVRLRQSAARPP